MLKLEAELLGVLPLVFLGEKSEDTEHMMLYNDLSSYIEFNVLTGAPSCH